MLALVVLCAVTSSVFVDGGTLTASVSAGLERERVATTTVAASASHRVGLRRGPSALTLEVSGAEGAVLLDREVSLSTGLNPALRVVTLLVQEALRGDAAARRAPLEAAARVPTPRFALFFALGVEWWSTPSAALPSLRVGGEFDLGPVTLGAAASAAGVDCCELVQAGSVVGTTRRFGGELSVRTPPLAFGPFRLSLGAAAGLSARTIDARALAYSGSTVSERRSAPEVTLRLGPALDLPLGRIGLRAAGGAEARAVRSLVRLPDVDLYPDEPLEPGILAPWVELGLIWRPE